MRRESILSLFLWLLLCVTACAASAPTRQVRARCDQVSFATPEVGSRRARELVIAINDEVCRREPLLPGLPPPRGRVADYCPAFEPGGNRIEIAVVEGACGRRRARAVIACAGPEPE